jgi:hypothetical protein
MWQRLQEAPFSGQLNHGSRNEWLAGRIVMLRDALPPRFYLDAEDLYLEALRLDPQNADACKHLANLDELFRRLSEPTADGL